MKAFTFISVSCLNCSSFSSNDVFLGFESYGISTDMHNDEF